ncbi:phage tail protein [Staphylococcus haemolyticus]|uniref:phage tail protein n=1 Tax=Staphylococcus haemolyticus TaxID=1283 RepID=UPI000D1E4F8A|nr:terminase [Staphylococcus haemolyticus]PTK69793.1 terminase [Staphylococcus haemolyticus]PTK69852.1 terminase [Staphylococcus haemolyticus]
MDKNFMVRIMANIRDFQNNVRKAQTLAKTSIPDEIETDVKANISKFQRNLQRAKAMAQRWREHKVEIDGDTNPIKRAISFAKAELQRLRDKQVDIKGDNDNLKRAVISAKAMLAMLHDKTVHVDFDTRGMTRAQVLTRALGNSLDEYGDKMDALATKIRTFGTVFSQQVKGLMIASIQGLIPVIAGLVPAIMAVLNAVGVLAGGILGLAGAFSIAGAGAFAFGGMAISALKMLKDGTLQATAETRRYQASLDQVKSTWESIIKQNQAQIFNTLANGLNTVNVVLSRMKPFLAGVSKGMEQASKSVLKWAENSQTASKFFNMMNTTGVKTFNTLLSAAGRFGDGLVNVFTQLGPLFLWTAKGLDNLGKKFQNWANSVAGQNAIKAFIEYTKTNLPKIGQIFGNVFAGIGNLMVAFAQNSAGIFDWLVKMTGKFREWSEQVGKSEGFKQFVKYVQQNGPVIMQLIGNIVRALVAFGKAMAPIASVILKVVNKLAEFIAKLFETHPAVAQVMGIIAILSGIFWALMAPVIAVSTVLSNVFGTSLFQVAKKILSFAGKTKILTKALELVKLAFKFLMNPIGAIQKVLPLLSGAFEAVGAALAGITWPVWVVIGVIVALIGIIVYLWKTNEDFRNMIIDAWNGIKDAISGAVQSIIDWFTQLWASIQQTLKPIMPLLQQVGSFIMQVLGGLVMGAIQLVIGAFQSLWLAISVIFTAIGGIISAAVQLIVGLFTAFIQFITGDFSGAWQTLQTTVQNVWTTIWNTIVSIFTQISEFIFNTLNSILGTNITSWSQIWSAIVQYVTQIWNSVTQWFGQMAQSVWNKMVQAYNYVVSTGQQWVSSITSTVSNFFNQVANGFMRVVNSVWQHMQQAYNKVVSGGQQWVSGIINAMSRFVQSVISGFMNVVSQVQSGMSRAVNTVRNFIGQFVSAGLDLMRGLVNGIKSGLSWVVDAARNVAQSAVNAAKSVLRIHSPSRVFRGIGQYVSQGLGMGILADQHKAVNAVRSVASNLTDAFKPELSTNLTDGLGGSLNDSVDAHMTKDVQHSMQENNRPIVNITVRNEGDVDYIKSYIEEQNGKNNSMGL